ncbi:acyltransferase [Hoeflea sp. EC-HK425]|uniref:acyltransferase family protein n=1 Tax=Hoeflea sp. EC-HK425 TaxID=2038388 RepID=UPI001255F859|nr:acyltransferase [Hoeflea sp. EC-HK425]VVT30820.1 putative acyltransferase [Hoeflea sp. EC-HK425]
MRQNYRLFGAWRLLAALLVMAYHFAHHAPDPGPVTTWFEHMLPLLDMFFIMSGFLIFQHYGDMKNTGSNYVRFLIKRLARLYPLHFATLSVFVLFAIAVHAGLLSSASADTRYNLMALPSNLLLLQAWGVNSELTFNYASWSVSGEWFAYLLFPIVLFAFSLRRLMGLALLLVLIVAILEFSDRGATDPYEFWFNTKLWAAYRIAADFVFGALLCAVAARLATPRYCQLFAWAVLGAVFCTMFAGANIYLILALFGVAITLAALADKTDAESTAWLDPLAPVTAVSFGVYMWHPVIELFAYSLFWNRIVAVDDPVLFWLFMPFPALATIVTAVYSARYFERPAGKWMEAALTKAVSERFLDRKTA